MGIQSKGLLDFGTQARPLSDDRALASIAATLAVILLEVFGSGAEAPASSQIAYREDSPILETIERCHAHRGGSYRRSARARGPTALRSIRRAIRDTGRIGR
jgi:hypothetical protein